MANNTIIRPKDETFAMKAGHYLKDAVSNIMTATGGKAIMSQREGVQNLGWSDDVDRTMQELADEAAGDVFEPTM